MTFLNATLIFGIAAIAAPIALHFLARREPKKVIFPSVRFLTKKFETNRSRIKIRRWWLLALRIAALAAMAIALARPTIARSLSLTWLTIGLLLAVAVALLLMASVALVKNQSKTTGYALTFVSLMTLLGASIWAAVTATSGPSMSIDQAQPAAIAIVLDNSPTSAWKTDDDDRISRMKELAIWMVTRLPTGSRVAIVDRSSQVASFSLDFSSAITRIEQLQSLEVVAPITARMETAARLVRSSELEQRRVLLITDLSIGTWDAVADETDLAASYGADPAVALTIFDLGKFVGLNRSLTVPTIADSSPESGIPATTVLNVTGADPQQPISVTVELEVFENDPSLPVVRDGVVKLPTARSVDRTSVKLNVGQSREIVLKIPSLSVGTHHGRIHLVGDDAMRLDDSRYFSIQILPPSRVLLIGDNAEESQVIAAAISASDGTGDESGTAFLVERIAYEDMSIVPLDDFEVLILLDPPRDVIGDTAVVQFVSGGGGVLVALGQAAGSEPIESALLPKLIRRWRQPDPGTYFQVIQSGHPVTKPLAADTPWNDFSVAQYWQIEPAEGDQVLIQYTGTDHAAVVERTLATGRVIMLTTPIPALAQPSRRWNDLFGIDPWPAWLLTRRSVEYLAGRNAADKMSSVGQPRLIGIQSEEERPNRLQLFRPGTDLPTPLDVPTDTDQVVINDVSRSGTYWIRGLETGAGFSANLRGDALRFQRTNKTELDQVFGADQYNLATDRGQIEFAESGAANQVSLHSPAMLLALVVFLLEQVLANRFYRKSVSN